MNPGGRVLLSPGDRVAGYEVDSYVARGGMAVVYRARDVALGRWVALKLIAPELAENDKFRLRFMRESEMAASIEHPNILPIYQAGEADGVLYIAMRFVEGQDLGKIMAAHAPLAPALVLPLFTQVAAALDTAHAHGLVHRDVKPGNMLVAGSASDLSESHVYLSDFGLTKRSSSLSGLTTAGHFMGTIAYVAPEQIQAAAVDHRADVYAMGCVIYEALAGVLPFQYEEESALLWAKMSADPEPLSRRRPDLPAEVDDALMHALARDPAQRTPSCRAVISELRAAFRGRPRPTYVPPAGGAVDRPAVPAPNQPQPSTQRIGQPRTSPHSGPQQAPELHPEPAPPVTSMLVTPQPVPPEPAGPVVPPEQVSTGTPEPGTPVPVTTRPGGRSPSGRSPGRPRGPALIGAACLAVIAALTGGFVIWQRSGEDFVTYQGTSANATWLSADIPQRWGRHGTRPGMCFCSEHIGPAIESGDSRTWAQVDATAGQNPGYVDGMYVREIPGPAPSSAADAVELVRARLARNTVQLSDTAVDVIVSGRPGWRVDGQLSSASNPDTTLDFHYYLVPKEGAVDHLMLFTRSDRSDSFMPMAGEIVTSIRLA